MKANPFLAGDILQSPLDFAESVGGCSRHCINEEQSLG